MVDYWPVSSFNPATQIQGKKDEKKEVNKVGFTLVQKMNQVANSLLPNNDIRGIDRTEMLLQACKMLTSDYAFLLLVLTVTYFSVKYKAFQFFNQSEEKGI